ncbi:MAG: FtsX-like permease family protein [Bacteroidetes bacterium]|nr:FtsX-like permease family protein [Bacteroidota bacterium]
MRFAGRQSGRFSTPVLWIAKATVALSVAVMLVSVSVVIGFKSAITNKMENFSAHLQLVAFAKEATDETLPIERDAEWLRGLQSVEGVVHIQPFATKPAIIKSERELEGVLLKGIDFNRQTAFFKQSLIEGTWPNESSNPKGVFVSLFLAKRLQLKLGQTFPMYYLKSGRKTPLRKELTLEGIFNTGLNEMDQALVLLPIETVQELYGWNSSQVSGHEVFFSDLDLLEAGLESMVTRWLPADIYPSTIFERYPDVFQWLPTLDQNARIILFLMITVSLLAMISTLLILILERTQSIGVLKALGMPHGMLLKIFWIRALSIVIQGMVLGNVGAGIFILTQNHTHLIPLNPEQYYLDHVPVSLPFMAFVGLNLGVFGLSMLSMLLPAAYASRIPIIKALKFA